MGLLRALGRLFERRSPRYWDEVYARELGRGMVRTDDTLGHILPLLQGHQRILDYGSGPGGNTSFLASHLRDTEFTLYDHSKVALDYAREKLLGDSDASGNSFRYLPKLDGNEYGYDAIYAIEVLEHLQKPREIVASLWERLQPGGILILSVPVRGWRDRNREHINKFTITSMFSLLADFSPEVTIAPRTYSRKSGKLATAFFSISKPRDDRPG